MRVLRHMAFYNQAELYKFCMRKPSDFHKENGLLLQNQSENNPVPGLWTRKNAKGCRHGLPGTHSKSKGRVTYWDQATASVEWLQCNFQKVKDATLPQNINVEKTKYFSLFWVHREMYSPCKAQNCICDNKVSSTFIANKQRHYIFSLRNKITFVLIKVLTTGVCLSFFFHSFQIYLYALKSKLRWLG